MARVLLGLGSNLQDRMANISNAIEGLSKSSGLRILDISPLYATSPVGEASQPWFINAVVMASTDLEPAELLRACKMVELQLGRTISKRWGPRIIDIDILLYDDQQINTSDLTIPHSRLPERAFVLVPLKDLLGLDYVIPGVGQSIGELIAALKAGQSVVPLEKVIEVTGDLKTNSYKG